MALLGSLVSVLWFVNDTTLFYPLLYRQSEKATGSTNDVTPEGN